MTETIDYTALDGPGLLGECADDASKWAAAFRQHAEKLGHGGLDEGWLIGWFANAIEHSGDVRRWRAEANKQSPVGVVSAGDAPFEFTSRYEALGIPMPDPATMCKGQCEGTGVYPCHASDQSLTEAERQLWRKAEDEAPAEGGWHFIRCPDCGGTGKAP